MKLRKNETMKFYSKILKHKIRGSKLNKRYGNAFDCVLAIPPCPTILSWDMGPLINLLKSSKLRLAMYCNHGGVEGACAIMVLCGEWWVVEFGGVVPTDNGLVNATPRK